MESKVLNEFLSPQSDSIIESDKSPTASGACPVASLPSRESQQSYSNNSAAPQAQTALRSPAKGLSAAGGEAIGRQSLPAKEPREATSSQSLFNAVDSNTPSAAKGTFSNVALADSPCLTAEREAPAGSNKERYPGAFSSDQPTPFEQSGMGEQYDPSGLHNARQPYYAIQHEKGFHRLIASMHVSGMTNREIAQEVDRSEVNISNILRQPYVQQYIVDEVRRLGGERVQLVLKGAALKAAQRLLVEIDNVDEGGSAQSRIASSKEVLDRVFGKAPQSVTHYDGGDVDQLTDAEISQRLKDLESAKAN